MISYSHFAVINIAVNTLLYLKDEYCKDLFALKRKEKSISKGPIRTSLKE